MKQKIDQKINSATSDSGSMSSVEKRLRYDRAYIKKHLAQYGELAHWRSEFLGRMETNMGSLGSMRAEIVSAKMTIEGDIGVKVKDFNVKAARVGKIGSMLNDIGGNLPSNPMSGVDYNVPSMKAVKLPDVPDFKADIDMDGLDLPPVFDDYNPPEVNGMSFNESDIIEKFRFRERESMKQRPPPTSSMKMPRFASIFEALFGWLGGTMSWIVFADLIFRIATCMRYIAKILRVQKRCMLSTRTQCRTCWSTMCSNLHVLIILSFIAIVLLQLGVAVSRSSTVENFVDEVYIHCHNRVVIAGENKRNELANKLGQERLSCDIEIENLNEGVRGIHNTIQEADMKLDVWDGMYHSIAGHDQKRMFEDAECVAFDIAIEDRSRPISRASVNLTTATALEKATLDVPSCRESSSVTNLQFHMRMFADALRVQVMSLLLASILLSLSGWFLGSALQVNTIRTIIAIL